MSRSLSLVLLLLVGVLALTLAACAPAPAAPAAPAPVPTALEPTDAPAAAEPTAAPTAPAATASPVATDAPATTAAPTAAVAATDAAPAAGTFPLTLKDDLGREVQVDARPAAIVSLAPSITEILFAVGAGSQVVGLTEYCDYPPDAQEGREVVGGFSADSMSIEKIVSLKPDLVFASGSTHTKVAEALEAAGILVFNMEPKDFPGIYADIRAAGALTGNVEQAEQAAADMQARVEKITEIAADIPEDERVNVFYEVWDEPLMSAGPATFIGQVIDMAGGVNIFADVKEEYPTVSSEAIIDRNPDVIVGPTSHGKALTVEQIVGRPGWADIQAVKDNRIVIVDGDIISRYGPRLADALEVVAQGIYPGKFE